MDQELTQPPVLTRRDAYERLQVAGYRAFFEWEWACAYGAAFNDYVPAKERHKVSADPAAQQPLSSALLPDGFWAEGVAALRLVEGICNWLHLDYYMGYTESAAQWRACMSSLARYVDRMEKEPWNASPSVT